MSLESLTREIASRVAGESGLGVTVKIAFEDGGVIFLDATASPAVVTNEDRDAQCTIRVSAEDLADILAGDLDATTAFMMGKLKVEGDMSAAMKLSGVL